MAKCAISDMVHGLLREGLSLKQVLSFLPKERTFSVFLHSLGSTFAMKPRD